MKKLLITGLLVVCIIGVVDGQGKFLTNDGNISFFSHTAIEDITAINNKVACVIDAATGEVAIIVKMTGFQFEKKRMQEHFNENYVESEKFPKATFNGSISNNGEVNYATTGTYQVLVEGDLTIHGITRAISTEGSVEVTGTRIIARTKFLLNPEDFDIKIPKVVRKNIAENMEIRAELNCDPI